MLAIMAVLLAGAGISRADMSADLWSNNTNMTCSYTSPEPVSGSSDNYQLSIYGTQLAWAMGSIVGTITTDGTDPTLQLDEQINNDTGYTWYDYEVTITMNQQFSFSGVNVASPSGWTDIVTGPTFNGSEWIGSIEYDAGNAVPNGGILDFNLSVTFTGNASFEEDLMPSVPEPGTVALMVCGLTGLLVMRRRSAMK
ncbi:MAG: PEP-CTERM sorting domain-containing protein [Limisphaerales bacterium]